LTAQGATFTDRAKATAAEARVCAEAELVEGDPAEVIVRRSTDFHLVVMGSHGKGLFQRLTLGSVTESVLHKIARPLLIVPAPR
jgi:nucleotide-binding universal stress UspA family protein